MSDPRYPQDEIGQPGDEDEAPGSAENAGPVFRDGPSDSANDISTTVAAMHPGDVATTDIWQEVWEPGVNHVSVPDDITGDAGTRPTSTFALVCPKGGVWEGVGGEPPQPNIGG